MLAVNAVAAPLAHADTPTFATGGLLPKTTIQPAPMSTAGLPASANLQQWAVPVGNQGQVGACTAWTIAYGMMGWYAQKNNQNAKAFAPMYAHAQIVQGVNTGVYPSDLMGIAINQGIDTQSDYAPGNYDYTTQPTTAQIANAAKSKFTGYKTLFSQQTLDSNSHANVGIDAQNNIQAALAGGQPVAIEIPVRPGFDSASSNLSVPITDYSGTSRGLHEVLALGYDANGLIFQNSWGTGWGANGYGRLSWDVVQKDVMEADVATGYQTQTNVPEMRVSQSTWTPVAAGATTTISTPSNTSWQLSSTLPSWLSLTSASGFGLIPTGVSGTGGNSAVTLTAQANTGVVRAAALTFTTTAGSPAASATITVTQASNLASVGTVTIPQAATVGSALTTTVSNVSPSNATLSYQWYRGSTAISGATGSSYTVTTADVGYQLHVTVTASASGYGSSSLTSASTSTVLPVASIGSLTISGTSVVGSTLTASASNIVPSTATLSYQWYRGTTAISGATGSTYVVTSGDAGSTLKVVATASASGYTPISVNSSSTSSVLLQGSLTVTVTGTAVVGSTVTAALSNVVPSTATQTYQWYRAGTAISGATGASYTLTSADQGKQIQVQVISTASGYVAMNAAYTVSNSIGGSMTSVGSVSISHRSFVDTRVGDIFIATTSNVNPSSATLSYQWYRSGVAISGATSPLYQTVADDAGSRITVTVTASASGYTTSSTTSVPTDTVLKPMTLTMTMTGTAAVGASLTAVPENLSPSNATIAYQWTRKCASDSSFFVVGGNTATYPLTSADAGCQIYAAMTATASGYVSSVASSQPLTIASALNIGSVTLSGPVSNMAVGSTVGTSVTGVSPSNATLSYQWYRNNSMVPVSGATSLSYTAVQADAGYQLQVAVTATASGYGTVVSMSALTGIVGSIASIGSVTMSGTPAAGRVLSVTAASVVPSNATLTYYWYRYPASGGVSTQVSSAQSYTVASADVGGQLQACVVPSAPGYGSPQVQCSALSATVTS